MMGQFLIKINRKSNISDVLAELSDLSYKLYDSEKKANDAVNQTLDEKAVLLDKIKQQGTLPSPEQITALAQYDNRVTAYNAALDGIKSRQLEIEERLRIANKQANGEVVQYWHQAQAIAFDAIKDNADEVLLPLARWCINRNKYLGVRAESSTLGGATSDNVTTLLDSALHGIGLADEWHKALAQADNRPVLDEVQL